ncbi:MAG: M24 family metallopeptidase [Alphaproteobacteria bacterium]
MALHFTKAEFDRRIDQAKAALVNAELDGLLMFSQESMYYLTGFDSFGFCFFQCLYLDASGALALLTRAPDLRQARHTSIIDDIRLWTDEKGARPQAQLKDMLASLGATGQTLGVEYNSHGLSAFHGKALDRELEGFCRLQDASDLISNHRAVKSEAELAYVRRAGDLADHALEVAISATGDGADEGEILAAMQGEIFRRGGDYSGNEFIIGSGPDALLCRYKSGRRTLSARDQLTLEFAGVYRHYHSALMRTLIVGAPTGQHRAMHAACRDALVACEAVMTPGSTPGAVFDAHAQVMDDAGFGAHRLNACGYGLGARFAPSWMDWPMFFHGSDTELKSSMVFFAHMILMDSDTGAAMTLGRSYIITDQGLECLSDASLDLTEC